jgi:hypothetical protein
MLFKDFKIDKDQFKQMLEDWYKSKDIARCPWMFYINLPTLPLLNKSDNNLKEYINEMQIISDLNDGKFCDICISLFRLKSYTKLRLLINETENVLGPCPCQVLGSKEAIIRLDQLKYFKL